MKKRKIFAIIAAVCSMTCVTFGISACKKDPGTVTVINGEKNKTQLSYEQLSATGLTLRIGETKTLTASTEISSWTTEDAGVATVRNGLVTSVGEGVTFIKATTINGETLYCLVKVTSVAFSPEIKLDYDYKTLRVGDQWSLKATVSVDEILLNDKIAWSISSENVSVVSEENQSIAIRAIAPGEATVYASLGETVVSCVFTVKEADNAVEGDFNGCEKMKNAPLTQIGFAEGAVVKGEYAETESVSVYQKAYYGEFKNTYGVKSNSLVAYATLSEDANKPVCLEYEGYYTYGFIVSVSQSHNETMGAYAEKTYRFYASENASRDGRYGVFIQNVLVGHYLVRAFIEYEADGRIVTKISENEVGAGDLRYEIVESADDFVVMINDSKCMSYGTSLRAEETNVSLRDIYGVTVDAAYVTEIPDTTLYKHYNAPKFRFRTGLTKALLSALRSEGYETLSFYTMFKTAESEVMSVNVLNEQADFSEATTSDGAGKVNSRYISSVVNGESNVWYYVEYSLQFLFDRFDLLFAPKTNYPFVDLDRAPMTGGTFYWTDFTVNRSVELIKKEVSITLNGTRINDEVSIAIQGDTVAMTDIENDYLYTVNGQPLTGGYVLAKEGIYVFTAQPKGENAVVRYEIIVGNGREISKVVNASELAVGTSDNQVYYHEPGFVLKEAAYKGSDEITFKKPNSEELGETKTAHVWSYSGKYMHYAGPQMHIAGAITKAELQALSDAGYSEMSFSFTVSTGVTDNTTADNFYCLDLAKVKAMIENSANTAAARETVQKAFKEYENTVIKDYMAKGWDYCCAWKTVTLSVADLIACYEVLDLLPLFYDSFVGTEYNVYITDFTFAKK